ncbi:MAG TPA: hypothetical protein DDY04_02365 [Bacteroidales bacterium]|nr:hypothetical protein [Bacteroidales bacterium]
MKKFFLLTVLFYLATEMYAQQAADNKETEKVKSGWNVGGLPVVAYDTDLGFEYGALVNLFHYGDGTIYPRYKHNIYAEVSRFTKGSGINRLFYDSKYVISGLRVTADLSYLTDKMYDFYGFNGYESVFNLSWADDESTDYRSRAFYKYDRKLIRFTTDFQGNLKNKKFGWVAGIGLYDFKIDTVDVDKLNSGKDEADRLPYTGGGLYQRYVDWGLINNDEKNGGFVTYLKVGAVYDTRDNEPNPMKGMWTEAVITYAPSFLGIESKYQHAKLSIIHRQYFTLMPERLSFVYRVGYQGTLFGTCPFYLQPNMTTLFLRGATNEGLGGSKSLRGIIRNRVVGDAIAYGNIELRWKFARFHLIKQNFYLSLNAFVDGGQVVKKVDVEIPSTVDNGYSQLDYFSNENEKLHTSWGLGLRVVMNQNFVIAVDYGRATTIDDGESGTYIGLNFLF